MSVITEFTSKKKTGIGRKSLSPSVRDKCHLCVKFGSQQGDHILLSLPRSPLSRLLSRSSRASTFQDIPQMESLLADLTGYGPRALIFLSARFGEYRSLAQRTMKKSKKMSKQ